MDHNSKILYISHKELTENGIMSKTTIDALTRRNQLERLNRGCNGTPALIAVDSLPTKYRTEVYRRFPDLKAQAESKPFVEMVEPDGAALNFFQNYKLSDGRYLSEEKQEEYANNAAILNAFRMCLERANSQRTRQSQKRINKADFWRKASQALPRIADTFPHSLPENPRRLQEKFNQYNPNNYEILITNKFGIKTAAKVATEQQESVMIRLLSDHRNLDNEQIAGLYNFIAEHQDWKPITGAAVGIWRKKCDLVTSAGRLGAANFHNTKAMQNQREKPTAPLLFWTMDGWDVELYYQQTETNKNGHKVTTYSNRLTMVVVLDPSAMYPVGYAIGTHETPELIKAALRDAANHTAALFGRRYRTNQLQSDHYAIKNLTPVYSVMSDKVTPAKVKNAKSKIIEPYFGYLNKTYFQYAPNWSGFGITANKYKQPNADALNTHRKEFPDLEGCIRQIIGIMEMERQKKLNAYLAKWKDLSDDRKLPLTDEQYLLNFGKDTGFRNALEGHGLCPKIDGVKRVYDCFDAKFREYGHIRWSVKYDPDNLDRVLAVNEDGTLRFLLETKYRQPMALADRKEGDTDQLARVENFNKQLRSHVIERLAIASNQCAALFAHNPRLDNSLAKAVLCDSNGQHKDRRNQKRLRAADIKAIEVETVPIAEPVDMEFETETENIYDLY